MKTLYRFHRCAFISMALGVAVASACAAPTPEVFEATREVPVTVFVEVTRVVPATVIVTQLVEVVITATPIPVSPTPAPTPTLDPTVTSEPTATLEPVATAEPAATEESATVQALRRWTSSQVAEAFRNAGLEISGVHPITPEEYGLAPMVAAEGSRFYIPSICAECGGRIFSFSSQEDLNTMRSYYTGLAERSAFLFTWVFTRDNILVQIRGDLDETRARQYEAALGALQ